MSLGIWIIAVGEVLFVLAFFAILRWSDRRSDRSRGERRR